MQGLMQDFPLTVGSIMERGVTYFPDSRIVTRTKDAVVRTTYRELGVEIGRLAGALGRLGLASDARVGSFAWNTARHLALYFAVPGTGRILHTINIRYSPDHIRFSIEHAEDEVIFVDSSLMHLLAPHLPHLPCVRHVVVMNDGGPRDALPDDSRIVSWDELLDGSEATEIRDRVSDENRAAALCYTSGTTGNPKGVLYSHRSIWLHSNVGVSAAATGVTDRDTVMPIVPMFHAMAWGLPYAAFQAGADLVLPGPDLSPAAILELMSEERVTYSAGVPSIWMSALPLLEHYDLSRLERLVAGGSAVPASLSEGYREVLGFPITQAWGMTEVSPLGAIARLRPEMEGLTEDEKIYWRATAGMALHGVQTRIVDAVTREELPWDDHHRGELEVRGPWVARQYYRLEDEQEQFSPDGWLRTGDVACISPLGFIRLVDRTKDLVKSGGEWISSVDLENAIMSHPSVAEAAVVAVAHPRWMERPLACVVVKEGNTLTERELLGFLAGRLERWLIPDAVVFLDEIPKTSVGKFSKAALRKQFADFVLPST
ncbi:long-chain fatty acid--CoA ligase [Sphaerimonospora sp. CA-214678]|uniref:long-chain fatty acid--CoA ligase n=1 Tax=Sphaerimonospora sp. CA-214678 TaxID=3240029 RepID=UPI003D9044E5